ncbi:MAG: class I SAM-dependent methyltransferase [Rugosibacter sp.]|jgi:2-isopropylmalate synthase
MSQQNWNASEYVKHASFVPTMANDVMGLLDPKEGEVILDVGCGDGELTQKLQEKGCSVIGIDSSPSMIETAKNRGIESYVMDGHNIPYQNKFDAVFSNAALHWLTQPERAIKGAYLALKVNGRFVAEFGGKGNIAALLKAMQEVFEENADFGQFHMPWFFPSVEEYQGLLEQAGFHVKYIELIPRPTPLKSGVEKWLEIFAEGITSHLSQEQKTVFLGSVKNKLLSVLFTEQSGWVADYVRLRFEATKT